VSGEVLDHPSSFVRPILPGCAHRDILSGEAYGEDPDMNSNASLALLIAITLGLPVLACVSIVLYSGSISPSLLTSFAGGIALMAFVAVVIIEIKRLADMP
jgi:hypothetical protein